MSKILHLVLALVLAAPAAGETLAEFAHRLQGSRTQDYYLDGRKVGWCRRTYSLARHDGQPVLVREYTLRKKCPAGRFTAASDKSIFRRTLFALEGQGAILRDEIRESEGALTNTTTAEVKGERLEIVTVQADHRATRRVRLPEENLSRLQQFSAWLKTAKPGQIFQQFSFDLHQGRDTHSHCEVSQHKKLADGRTGYAVIPADHAGVVKSMVLVDGDTHIIRMKVGRSEFREQNRL